jgi:multicomponent Na+:H+ antiporter subunit E
MQSAQRPGPSSTSAARGAILRGTGFFALWLILSGADLGGLPAGAVAVVAATWTSLRLLPASAWRLSPLAVGLLVLRFLRESILAGADVARRALDPRLPLRPDFVTYPVQLAPGAVRNTFCTLSSLLPGTLPAGSDESGALLVHCLDIDAPIMTQLSEEEALLVRALGGRRDHG